ncbi:hypothetical protein LNKW23_17910 [Paralimibaculum aggregatum]|uniref:Uncharacterized protein n=1 Tax=Paralimibaculum aggregatum TaxID=3036245 RepID=A0ABQ6LH03_9RHOB|nr:hypothetical protein [Limibaculum sp. NKW23]GMG82578.1 hypothetical protein LNKW23_17910 [Limibaculum sp. NKW23]
MKTFSAAVEAELLKDLQHIRLFCSLETSSGTLRLWTGIGQKTYASVVWEGAGDLLAFSSPRTASDLTIEPMTVTLSGVPQEHIARAITERVTRRRLTVEMVWLDGEDDATANVVGGAGLWEGYGSLYGLAAGGRLSLQAEGRLALARGGTGRVWSAEDQRHFVDADDAFFDGVAALQNKDLGAWGRTG